MTGRWPRSRTTLFWGRHPRRSQWRNKHYPVPTALHYPSSVRGIVRPSTVTWRGSAAPRTTSAPPATQPHTPPDTSSPALPTLQTLGREICGLGPASLLASFPPFPFLIFLPSLPHRLSPRHRREDLLGRGQAWATNNNNTPANKNINSCSTLQLSSEKCFVFIIFLVTVTCFY